MANKSLKTIVLEILEDKQAEAVETYDVKGQSPLTDWIVVATINNFRKMEAIVFAFRKQFSHHEKYKVHHIEGQANSGWMIIDLFDVVIHLMDQPTREQMKLDEILSRQAKR
jgi:ribosome-associated protein